MTFLDLLAAEPRLAELLEQARRVDDSSSHYCCNRAWYGQPHNFERRLRELVGPRRFPHPVLGSDQAYRIADAAIYDVLPECRDCSCT